MHLTRAEITMKVPIMRKGTRYIARPLSHTNLGVSVLSAVRDMLHLAHTAKEVKEMIKDKAIKINGRVVRDYHEPICLLSLFEAGKKYKLVILPTGRFSLELTTDTKRIVKIINKKALNGKVIQLNGHDGTNVNSKEKVSVGDSVEVDMNNKLTRVIMMEKGKKVLIESGRNKGTIGTIATIEGSKVTVKIDDQNVVLDKNKVIVL